MKLLRRPAKKVTVRLVRLDNSVQDNLLYVNGEMFVEGSGGEPFFRLKREGVDDFTITMLRPFITLELDREAVTYYEDQLYPSPPQAPSPRPPERSIG